MPMSPSTWYSSAIVRNSTWKTGVNTHARSETGSPLLRSAGHRFGAGVGAGLGSPGAAVGTGVVRGFGHGAAEAPGVGEATGAATASVGAALGAADADGTALAAGPRTQQAPSSHRPRAPGA
jgi:hypothetical protein